MLDSTRAREALHIRKQPAQQLQERDISVMGPGAKLGIPLKNYGADGRKLVSIASDPTNMECTHLGKLEAGKGGHVLRCILGGHRSGAESIRGAGVGTRTAPMTSYNGPAGPIATRGQAGELGYMSSQKL